MQQKTNERRFHGSPERLESEQRLAFLEIDRVVNLCIEGLKSGRVLDIGTGTGVFARAFVGKGFAVAGIDVNDSLLELARKKVPQAEFQKAVAEKLPYKDGAFAIAFLGHLLHEADDPVQVLREAGRVAKTRVAVLEWPYEKGEHGPPLEHRLSSETILGMARQAGLHDVEHLRLKHMDFYRMTPGRA